MKLLNVKPDVVSVKLDDGRVILVKEKEVVILNGPNLNKCKVGYDDAEIMSLALKTIFADVFEELNELRKKTQPIILQVEKVEMSFKP